MGFLDIAEEISIRILVGYSLVCEQEILLYVYTLKDLFGSDGAIGEALVWAKNKLN